MDRVFAHKRISGLDGLLLHARFVIRKHQVELELPTQVAERVACLDGFVNLDAAPVVAT